VDATAREPASAGREHSLRSVGFRISAAGWRIHGEALVRPRVRAGDDSSVQPHNACVLLRRSTRGARRRSSWLRTARAPFGLRAGGQLSRAALWGRHHLPSTPSPPSTGPARRLMLPAHCGASADRWGEEPDLSLRLHPPRRRRPASGGQPSASPGPRTSSPDEPSRSVVSSRGPARPPRRDGARREQSSEQRQAGSPHIRHSATAGSGDAGRPPRSRSGGCGDWRRTARGTSA
jgi:hypothetical protein